MNQKQISYPVEDRYSYLYLIIALLLGLVSISIGKWIIPLAAWLGPIFIIRFMRTQRKVWLAYLILVVTSGAATFIAMPESPETEPDKWEASPFLVEYEMGYGADEFGKVLGGPFVTADTGYRLRENGRHRWAITRDDAPFELAIEVAEQPARKLGLFNLPVLAVKFTFIDTAEALRERFFHRFHQYFHKGGG